MSHIGIRLLADWLASPDTGVDTIAAILPLDAGDAAPRSVHIYDDTRNNFAQRRTITQQDLKEGVIVPPALIVMLHDLSYNEGIPTPTAEGGEIVTGTLTALVFLVNQQKDTAIAATENTYLVRAFRNSLLLFNKAPVASRSRLGVLLDPSTAANAADVGEIPEDLLVPDAQLITYPLVEAVAIAT